MQVYLGILGVVVIIAALADLTKRTPTNEFTISRPLGIAGFLVFLILATVSSLRWGVGTDYWNYLNNFPVYAKEASNGLRLFGGDGIALWEEPGIRFISLAVQSAGGTAIGMLAVAAFVTVFLYVRTIWRYSPALSFGIAIYILSGSWYGSFNVIRQHLAAAILFAGHRYVLERKFCKWILIVFLASLFHFSAWIGIFFYFIPQRKLSFIRQLGIIVVALIVSLASSELLDLVEAFQNGADLSQNINAITGVNQFRIVFAFLPILIFWLLPRPKSMQSENAWFYANMLLVYGALMLSMSTSVLLARFMIYPQAFLALCLPIITDYEDKNTRTAIRILLFVLYLVFMIVEVTGSTALREFSWIFDRV